MQKKRSKESRYRTRFVWIDPVGKSFNWSKSVTKEGKHKLVQADLMSRVVSSAPTKALRRSSVRLQHCLTIELKDEGTEGHIDLMVSACCASCLFGYNKTTDNHHYLHVLLAVHDGGRARYVVGSIEQALGVAAAVSDFRLLRLFLSLCFLTCIGSL